MYVQRKRQLDFNTLVKNIVILRLTFLKQENFKVISSSNYYLTVKSKVFTVFHILFNFLMYIHLQSEKHFSVISQL